ncbi:hypothetical protein H6P81_002422 [Aristolochia fimbriata]|uniref:Uncharacterized protein n=1 Tax=Aristolochia fimbriata TaxID=158543 RepID=A0AAV7FBH6_ARIFI|nr:hypothetical protein H6P81_002422 [Aristolochia fimbriata]
MGNGVSCSFKTSANSAKCIDPDGNIRKLALPVEAAEVMLECPGCVVAPAKEVLISLRVAAMRADEELKPGELYLVLPAARAGCRARDAELRAIVRFSKKKRRMCCTKVFPVSEKEVKIEEKRNTGSPCSGMKSYRNWAPVLETISEGM